MNIRVGQSVTIRATCRNAAGAIADASTFTFKLRTPAGVESSYVVGSSSATRTGTGTYAYTCAAAEVGTWFWRAVATGTVADADEGAFQVIGSKFAAP